ncbi:MAG TPA: ABC transporter ATP-binding protein [Gemmatimonadaceae bacterium]
MTSFAIETRGLTHRFGSRTVLESLDLEVPHGSICGFLGPNGAGKTTTIRLLLGLISPSEGQIFIDGARQTRDETELRKSIGALVETPSVYPHLTGRENLEVIRRLVGLPLSNIDDVLRLVGLGPDADAIVRTYSLGMRQRLGLAGALLGHPTLLILDEPANGLDPAGVHDLRDLLRYLVHEGGATVFLSSHLLGEVEQIADHIAILDRGRLVFQGSLTALQSQRGHSLAIRVDRPEAAEALLREHGWMVQMLADGVMSLDINAAADAATINALLVGAGFMVLEVTHVQATLESLFFSATSGASERAGA